MNNELVMQKVIERVNNERRQELIKAIDGADVLRREIQQARLHDTYTHGSKDKTWRKVATLPAEVDAFFCKLYGDDYYKDKDFFSKRYTEWSVIDPRKI